MMKNYIQQIIELFGHNEYSLATRRKVQRWLADDNHAEEKKEALHTLWQQAGEQKVPRGMQQSILRMQQNLGMQSVGSGKKYQLLIWRAAAIFLLAVSSVSIYLMLEKDKLQKDLVECFIPTAEIRELTLPDGTRVMLNSRSTLLYPEQFAGKTRSVYLIGEANFQVKPDEKHPFIVKANDFQITALGTEFNVRTYVPDDSHVTLLKGSVKVKNTDSSSEVVIQPGEDAHLQGDGTFDVREVDTDNYYLWTEGYFYFDNESVVEIMRELGRWYNIRVEFENLRAMNYRLHFLAERDQKIEEVLQLLNMLGKVQATYENNKISVK